MATHSRTYRGTTHSLTYRWRFGLKTPAWLDRAATPTTERLDRALNRLHLIRRTYTETPAEP